MPPTISSGDQPLWLLRILNKAGSKEKNYLILGLVGLMVIGFFVYGILIFGSVNSQIRYSPGDVVYGEELQAIHNMETGNYVSLSENTAANQSIKPEIRLSETFYDFGEIGSTQVVTRTFVIANLGQSPLVIQRAYTTCGCTTADFTASVIPPGKVVLMTLRFDAGYHAMSGSTIRRGVMIETNDPDHPIQEIWIQASVLGNGN
jgi:hypothetical protein